ncbi:MAG: DUF1289 domain-containing protein [Hyphomicrobiales bacterium]|nr:DUF1289 domain-containing protein [Hyphomicrobiales bacterium]
MISTPPPTPCVGVCRIEAVSGLCLGCARTGEEIALWRDAGPEAQTRIWAALPERRAALDLRCYRLPWSAADIGAFIEASLRENAGVWMLGVPGAELAFAAALAQVGASEGVIAARAASGALTLVAHLKAVAFAIAHLPGPTRPNAVGLALPRGRVDFGAETGLRRITDAHGEPLFDIGLGRRAVRLAVRAGDPALARHLGAMAGCDLGATLHALGGERLDLIMETGLARLETRAALADVLDLSLLKVARDTSPDWPLDAVFAPGARLSLAGSALDAWFS